MTDRITAPEAARQEVQQDIALRPQSFNDDEFIDFLTRLDALTQRVQDLDRRIDALGQ